MKAKRVPEYLAFVGTAIFAFILPLNPTKIVRRGLREDEKVCKKEEKQKGTAEGVTLTLEYFSPQH
jgi:hypothetical protein